MFTFNQKAIMALRAALGITSGLAPPAEKREDKPVDGARPWVVFYPWPARRQALRRAWGGPHRN